MAQSLINYVKNNPVETAINVATLIPAVGGVIKGGSLLYKGYKQLKNIERMRNKQIEGFTKAMKTVSKQMTDDIIIKPKIEAYKILGERYTGKKLLGASHEMPAIRKRLKMTLLDRKRVNKLNDAAHNADKKFMQDNLKKAMRYDYLNSYNFSKAQKGLGLIAGGLGTSAHLSALQK